MLKRSIWTLGAAGGLLAATVHADSVSLTNGDRVSGTLVRMERATLWVETPYAGTLKLPWAQVSRVETDAPVRLRMVDGTELAGRLQTDAEGAPRLAPGGEAAPQPLALARIDAINPPALATKAVLDGRGSLGGSISSGNTEAQSLHIGGDLVARKPAWRITLDGERNKASQDGRGTASNWRLGMKYDRFHSNRSYLYANTRFDHDRQAGLDLRSTLGIGAGRQFVESETLKLSAESGLSWVKEDYAHAPDEHFPSARIGIKYEQSVWQGRLQLFHSSDVLVSLESREDYLYKSRSGVRVPVDAQLSVGAQLNYDYDAVPAAGKEPSDTAVIVKLDYKL